MPSCPANVRETKIAFGKVPQVDVKTRNLDADLWSLTKTNASVATVEYTTEDNSDDIGQGDEFPTQNFKVSASTTVPLEKYTSSEFAAWAFLFALGKGTKTGITAPFLYTAVPSDPVVECINVPPFTFVEQIRPEPDSVLDRALIGCVINDFALMIESGPGRANCRLNVNCLGTGWVDSPSAVAAWPALTPEHPLNATGATMITINGIDYLLGGSFISMEFRYTNNVRTASGYYPGSGAQNGFATRGRMEYNKREFSLNFVARAQRGSVEFNNLMNQVEGNTRITIPGAMIGAGPGTHLLDLHFPRTVLSAETNGEAEGLVTVVCQVKLMKPTDNVTPIASLMVTTETDNIFNLQKQTNPEQGECSVFDIRTEIASKVWLKGELVELAVRWPSDQQWIERSKARRVIIKRLGRGKTDNKVEGTAEADLKLYEAVKLEDAPTLSAAEASIVIETIAQCDVTNCQVSAGTAQVELTVITGTVVHELSIPSADDVLKMRRAAVRLIELPYSQQEIRTTIEPGGRLWDQCGGSSKDYAGGTVPVLHKDTAIRGLIDFLDREMTAGPDESAF